MKMVKSLLLGTAAGFVAIAGAQAADLPVKAKPVQYVKICSLYGAGFYYIPGTDTCIKIGGYVRVQAEMGAIGGGNPNIQSGPTGSALQSGALRDSSDYGFRARGVATFDVRSQTEYGTLRSYFNLQLEHNDGTADLGSIDRAFIQLAGFTVGLTTSYYDFLSWAPYTYHNNLTGVDSGAVGTFLAAYTWQFGNGLSASLSFEDQFFRQRAVVDTFAATIAAATVGTAPANDVTGRQVPDIVGNMRIEQTWGNAQIMGALHRVQAQYFGASSNAGTPNHPSDEWGYAVGGGLQFNLPMLGKGDLFAVQATWAEGATAYAIGGTHYSRQVGGSDLGFGMITDAVFGGFSEIAITNPGQTSLELTESFNLFGVYQHNWNPNWKTSIYGGYSKVGYSDAATNLICQSGGVWATLSNCDPDFAVWQAGSRTAWLPVANLEIGLDILYSKLETASAGTSTGVQNTALNPTVFTIADQDVWTAMVRVQRVFWP